MYVNISYEVLRSIILKDLFKLYLTLLKKIILK